MDIFWTITFRTIILYFVLLTIFRLMGKREVGELSVIDLVIFVLMAEVAAYALDNPKRSLWESILPMVILLLIQIGASYLSLKSKKTRDLIEGDPSIIIRNGEVLESEMRKQRYNLDDLFQQLREQQIGSVSEVAFAFLEPSGNLSVFKKDESLPILPLIVDGDIQERHLRLINKSKDWLEHELQKKKVFRIEDVFLCGLEKDGLWIQMKVNNQSNTS